MKNKLIILSGFIMGLAPVVALAQTTGGNPTPCGSAGTAPGTLQGILCKISEIFNAVLPVLIGLGVIYFVWGVVQYVIASDEEAKKTGRDRIVFGIIGLAIIISVWGLVAILRNTFGFSNAQNIVFPTVPY